MNNNNYANGKIYKIQNDLNDIIYIGSTICSLTRRFAQHKHLSKTCLSRLYMMMRQIGIDHFEIVLIEDFPCESKAQLEAHEYMITNAFAKDKLYNTRFDGKMKHTNDTSKKIGVAHTGSLSSNFTRGYITKGPNIYIFVWSHKSIKHAKSYSFGNKRTQQEAYMLCINQRNLIHPLTHNDYMKELPVGLLEEELL